MAGSTDAATIAERTKLQAQLEDAKSSLDDTYYNHAMDSQSSALDDENESYVTSKEDYIEMLRESLENTEQVVADTMTQVFVNADTILGTLNETSSQYGITLSDSLKTPWINAAAQAEAFKNSAMLYENEFIVTNGIFTSTISGQLNTMFGEGSLAATGFQTSVAGVVDAIKTKTEEEKGNIATNLKYSFEQARDYAVTTFDPNVVEALGNVANKAKDFNPDSDSPDKVDLQTVFENGTDAANTFGTEAAKALQEVIDKAKAYTPNGTADGNQVDLTDPFNQGKSAADEFGKQAEEVFKKIAKDAETYDPTTKLTSPPNAGGGAWDLFGTKVSGVLSTMVDDANTAATNIGKDMDSAIAKANAAAAAIANAGKAGGGGGGGGGGGNPPTTPTKTQYKVTATVSTSLGLYKGTATRDTVASAQAAAKAAAMQNAYESYKNHTHTDEQILKFRKSWSNHVSYSSATKVSAYAKGTLGTKQNEWAYTDEPWLGDELVLVPGKNGNLQYMRKGTAVIPADISANLMEWGKLNPNMDMSNAIQGVNLMTNVVNKPETNLTFDSLLHIDNCTNEVIPEVKKIITEQLENFTKKLNYNLKRVGG